MDPILNKAEIVELLKAIRAGKIPLDLEDGGEDAFLACSPINLFQLARPDKEQFRIPNFDIIVDIFCRLYATSLTNQLQRTFSILRKSLETYEFQKFMADKSQPGGIAILDMAPLKHGALIIIDPKLSFAMIEIMLGAATDMESPQLNRRLTTIELSVLKTLFDDACRDLNKAFAQLLELNSALMKLENNARLVSIVEPEAEVIVGTLLVKVGEYSGEIHLIFPYATLEPLRDLLRELLNFSSTARGTWQDVLEDEILDVPSLVTAQSGRLTLSVNQILNMKAGDILNLDYDPSSPLKILVEDQVKFSAIPGTLNGKKAISLNGIID